MGTIQIQVPEKYGEDLPIVLPDGEAIEKAVGEGMTTTEIAKSVVRQEVGVRDNLKQKFLGWIRLRRFQVGTEQAINSDLRRKGFLSERLGSADTPQALIDRYRQKMRRLRRELIQASVHMEELGGNGLAALKKDCETMPAEARRTFRERQKLEGVA